MRHLLQCHPFAVRAHFEWTLVLTFALPAATLRPLLPPGLTLDEYDGRGFVAVALVQTRRLRPAGWPASLGHDFFLSGYRIFTRYRTAAGRTLRGLRILRSDTDRRRMVLAGNLLTHYGYRFARIVQRRTGDLLRLEIRAPGGEADLKLTADLSEDPARSLPPGSPFPDWHTARRYAGPLPYTFDYEPETHSIIRIEGIRQEWHPRPVSVRVEQATFFKHGTFAVHDAPQPVLASAFFVENIPYLWRRGIRERLPEPVPVDRMPVRGRWQGVSNIVRFNWPFYAVAAGVAATALAAAGRLRRPWWLRAALSLGSGGALFYLGGSLAVSWWIYDRSPLYKWTWLRRTVAGSPRRIVNVHSGFDESSEAVRALFPEAELTVLDFYDPAQQTERSIARARAAYPPSIPPREVRSHDFGLPGASADLVLLILAAHEVRTAAGRDRLFAEAARILRPGGQAILVEHGRDAANFLAFGPGFLHFFAPAEWRRAARAAGLKLAGETRITPFVRVFNLRR